MAAMNAEGMDIINIRDYGDALRNSGYKDIESAMAEIVDNSIQADAKNILVIIKDRVPSWGKRSQVYEVAFLDDGTGMAPEWVQGCLRFGNGTRKNAKGMGKFGVGLPQSSLYACPRVEVYSWQDGIDNTYSSFLDIEMISKGEQLKIEPAEKKSVPKEYQKYIKKGLKLCNSEFDFSKHGTLVLWRACDNVVPSTVNALFKRLVFSFGKKYRHLIYDETSNIFLIHDTKDQYNKKVMKNAKDNPFRQYMDFLYGLHELSADEEAVYHSIGREFLSLIETTDMQKVYKMPILYSFYNHGEIRLAVTEDEVLESWKEFFNIGTNWKDLMTNVSYAEYQRITDKQHLSKAKSMPIKFLKASGKGFFIEKEGYALAIREELAEIMRSEAFKRQMKDILDYRTMEYYRRRYLND